MEESEMGRVYSTHGRDDESLQNFGRKNLNERDHLEDLSVDGKIILEWILGNRVERCGMAASGSG
jgi:hypothetical protein